MEGEGGPPEHEAVPGNGEAADDRPARLEAAIEAVGEVLEGGALTDLEKGVIRALHGGCLGLAWTCVSLGQARVRLWGLVAHGVARRMRAYRRCEVDYMHMLKAQDGVPLPPKHVAYSRCPFWGLFGTQVSQPSRSCACVLLTAPPRSRPTLTRRPRRAPWEHD